MAFYLCDLPLALRRLFALVSLSLFGKSREAESIFAEMSKAAWADVRREARRQTVEGIAFEGVRHLPSCFYPPEEIMLPWIADTAAIIASNERQKLVARTLSRFLCAYGVRFIVRKGIRSAGFYPKPELRQSGDIDCFFSSDEDFIVALRLLERQIPEHRCGTDGARVFILKGVPVELHSSDPYAVPDSACGRCSPATAEVVGMAFHILRHSSMYGIGLRHLCDIAMAYSRFASESTAFRQNIAAEVSRRGISVWWKTLECFMTGCLEVPVEIMAFQDIERARGEIPRGLSDVVTRGGNFGFHGPERSGRTLFHNFRRIAPYAFRHVTGLYISFLWHRLRKDTR